jgi:hypothetical protein
MSDSLSGLVLQVLAEIDDSQVLAHVLVSDISDPSGDGGREEANLELTSTLLLDSVKNFVNIFFESELEHLISLIEHNRFDAAEVNVASLDVIQDTSGGSDKEVDSTSELSGLVLDRHSTVDSEGTVFGLSVLESSKFSRDL